MIMGNYPSVSLREQTGSRKRMVIPQSILSLHRASSLNFDPFFSIVVPLISQHSPPRPFLRRSLSLQSPIPLAFSRNLLLSFLRVTYRSRLLGARSITSATGLKMRAFHYSHLQMHPCQSLSSERSADSNDRISRIPTQYSRSAYAPTVQMYPHCLPLCDIF